MNAAVQTRTPSTSLAGEDERSLLIRLERMLEREEALFATRDAVGLTAIAEEREHVTERLAKAARVRHAAPALGTAEVAELLALYRRLRQRHEVQAQVVRRHVDRNARAIGVLAQATGQSNLYQSNGRVTMQFVSV